MRRGDTKRKMKREERGSDAMHFGVVVGGWMLEHGLLRDLAVIAISGGEGANVGWNNVGT